MATWARWARWALGVAALALPSVACEVGDSCTDIGCASGVAASVAPKSGVWQEGDYTLTLMLDGEQATCSFLVPEDVPPPGRGSIIDCARGAEIELFLPASGPLRLTLHSEPKTLKLELLFNGGSLLSDERTLVYRKNQPNAGCEPICRNAIVELTTE